MHVKPEERGAWRPLLRAERLHQGLSQAEVAARAHVSTKTVSNLETSSMVPQERVVRAVQSALGLPDDLAAAREAVGAYEPPRDGPGLETYSLEELLIEVARRIGLAPAPSNSPGHPVDRGVDASGPALGRYAADLGTEAVIPRSPWPRQQPSHRRSPVTRATLISTFEVGPETSDLLGVATGLLQQRVGVLGVRIVGPQPDVTPGLLT